MKNIKNIITQKLCDMWCTCTTGCNIDKPMTGGISGPPELIAKDIIGVLGIKDDQEYVIVPKKNYDIAQKVCESYYEWEYGTDSDRIPNTTLLVEWKKLNA